jgi:hypothetical protein
VWQANQVNHCTRGARAPRPFQATHGTGYQTKQHRDVHPHTLPARAARTPRHATPRQNVRAARAHQAAGGQARRRDPAIAPPGAAKGQCGVR